MTPAPVKQCGSRIDSGQFRSILFHDCELPADLQQRQVPEFFSDLNIDQIVDSITTGRDEYNLRPYFYVTLNCVETVKHRQDVFQGFANPALLDGVRSFAASMRAMRAHLATREKSYYKYQKHAWFLASVETYCKAALRLLDDLSATDLHSFGLVAFREYLRSYISSDTFALLVSEADRLRADLSSIKYSLHIEGKQIKVSRHGAEPDYGADVLRTFEKFKQGAGKRYQFSRRFSLEINHIEAGILDLVAQLHSEVFASLEDYSNRHRDYLDITITNFDREVQFYVACLDYIELIKRNGLPFCYPEVSKCSKEVYGREAFDLALAIRLAEKKVPIVTNDFYLKDPERIIVVSGPNQGGKTTFARTFGQVHYLGSIGCPVPGTEAKLFLFDQLFTHFEKEEHIQNLSGRLEDDLLRLHHIFELATANSIVIMNESFVSTALSDAIFLSRHIMRQVVDREMLCVTVTFLDELACLDKTTVSMVSTVDPQDPASRTFKVIRKPADGLAYAMAIAEKYHLTHAEVISRISGMGQKQ